jgi:hypothetical protein
LITIFTAVSFAKVPFAKVGVLAQDILNHGWVWSRNDADGIYHFRKDVPETPSAMQDAESEIAAIMGACYVDADELRERAEQWRAFMLGEGPPPEFASEDDAPA